MPSHAVELLPLAAKYIWWIPADEAVLNPARVIAQVMNLGTWDDVAALEKFVSRETLAGVLRGALPGWFSGPSWTLWHLRLGLASPDAVPARPVRSFA
jgi:hypothetical protein